MVLGRHDQGGDTRYQRFAGTGRAQGIGGEVRAPRLVVAAARIVDRVMKPDGQCDLAWLIGQIAQLVEAGKAFIQVLQGVVVALWLTVAGH